MSRTSATARVKRSAINARSFTMSDAWAADGTPHTASGPATINRLTLLGWRHFPNTERFKIYRMPHNGMVWIFTDDRPARIFRVCSVLVVVVMLLGAVTANTWVPDGEWAYELRYLVVVAFGLAAWVIANHQHHRMVTASA